MPPSTINLSITHELIAKTFSSNLLSSCERGEDKIREQDKAVPASSSLKLLQLSQVDGHLAAQIGLAQRSVLLSPLL